MLFPPISSKTLLRELIRVRKFPISNETEALGEPKAPALVAERLVADEGQNQAESGDGQLGSRPEDGINSPFEPLSMKLLNVLPLKCVVISPT